MMTDTELQFPTMAEKVRAQFLTSPVTVKVEKLAQDAGAFREKDGKRTIYRFDDDTSLVVTGKGAGHRIEARLP